jgi:Lamin Tail Domain/Secretion system C-terminal sorting domain/SprB repeat
MKKLITIAAALFTGSAAYSQCSELFFSEYLEGSSNNKAIEFYNPTSNTVNLADYVIYRYNNGSPTPTDSLHPQGTLAPGAVFVAGNSQAVVNITSVSDTLHSITFYNGDDAMVLKNKVTNTVLDIIGIVGVDPGTNWPVGTGATSEFTLVRKVTVQQGNTNWAVAATEWDVYPQNTFTYIGAHTMNSCCSAVTASVASSANVACFGDSTGTATISATGVGLTYTWTPYGANAATVSNLAAGTYTVIVADACSNADTVTVSISQNAFLDTTNVVAINPLCNGDANGSISIAATGGVSPYTYSWSTTATTPSINGLTAGTYTYTITDAAGCTRSDFVALVNPPVLTSTITATNATCFGSATGSAQIITAGGNSNCTYVWSNNATTATISGLTAGIYNCVATDVNGCSVTGSVTVTQPAQLVLSINASLNPTSCSVNDGSVDLGANGGTAGYTYLWSNGATTEDISGLGGGFYSVTVTDANGCTASAATTLAAPNAPSATLALTDTLMCLQPGTITLSGGSPAGGTWSGLGVSGNTFDPMTAGAGIHTIVYTVYDSLTGCSGFATDIIEVEFCIGVTESNTDHFTVYPNPSQGIFTVGGINAGTVIEITDLSGKQVSRFTATASRADVDLSASADGVYFIRVINDHGVNTQRILLAR